MSTKLVQRANIKLGKNTVMFNIPATVEVCGRVCDGCYSHKAYKMYPNVLPAQERRLKASKRPDFVVIMNKELANFRKAPTYFRIHGSAGEFYSQEYINAWQEIVTGNPKIIFYAYTKRKKDFNFSRLQGLQNMVLINSMHFGGINFNTKDNVPSGAFVCPSEKGKVTCGVHCTWCMQKGKADKQGVFFIKH